MRGIREAALSSEPEYIPPKHFLLGDDYYGYDYLKPKEKTKGLFDYDNYPAKSYKAPVKGVIEIKLSVSANELGPVADETTSQYDWNLAQNKAEQTAYDKIQELLGKDFDSRFSIEFNTYDDGESYEVSCILTPV